ncbi:MAG: NADPH-dependent glutamate synthase [Oscillospiraceae bacterium]|nr:NADPH-dependent glutamate synthase [Oscillospiraceae bacterium]
MDNLKKTPVEARDPQERIKDFKEVSFTYTPEQAMAEAKRCLNCKNSPCVAGCPVGVKIPEFIKLIAEGKFEDAYGKIVETNGLPAVCGRVCPQENQCEGKCIRGIKGDSIGIGALERFAADRHREMKKDSGCSEKTANSDAKKLAKVAIIGAGPAGLACASDLADFGFDVTIFEAFHIAGGVLAYGIPEFRLPKSIVADEIEAIKKKGVEIKTDYVIGRIKTIDELMESGYEAVFISTGAGLPKFMGIPGEGALGTYSANEYLTRINLMKAYREDYDTPLMKFKKVAVVGGGNVAMDAARCARRMGAETYIVYRRSEKEMPARAEEKEHAKEEGIIFKTLTNPVEILEDENKRVRAIKCVEMELSDPDESGRRRPVVKENSEFEIEVDGVIMAIGSDTNPVIGNTTEGLETNKKGCIVADENMATTRQGIFAGGDTVTGAATVILAMGAGRTAAASIKEYIEEKHKK